MPCTSFFWRVSVSLHICLLCTVLPLRCGAARGRHAGRTTNGSTRWERSSHQDSLCLSVYSFGVLHDFGQELRFSLCSALAAIVNCSLAGGGQSCARCQTAAPHFTNGVLGVCARLFHFLSASLPPVCPQHNAYQCTVCSTFAAGCTAQFNPNALFHGICATFMNQFICFLNAIHSVPSLA